MSDYSDSTPQEGPPQVDNQTTMPPAQAPLGKSPQEWAEFWAKELNASRKWFQRWHAAGNRIEQEYLGKPNSQGAQIGTSGANARFNVFWANVQVLLAAVFSKMPKPEVDRTHLDAADDVARVAALILERIFEFELKNLDDSPVTTYQMAIKDRFIAGLGQVWPRFEFKEQTNKIPPILHPETGQEMAPAVEEVVITDEAAPIDYVRWDDFTYSPCKVWEKRRWSGRRVFMGKDDCVERFGDVIAGQIAYKTVNKSVHLDDPMKLSPEPMAEIYELWHKKSMTVFWVNIGCPVVLDYKTDPLKLSGFYPVKRPLIASTVTAAYIPTPDYNLVEDQYMELNMLAQRCSLLTSALKLVGVYDKTADGIQRMLNQAAMNQLIPVDNWAMFAEKGGIKGSIDWLPLDMVVDTLGAMTERKKALMQEIYEILGLSDVMHGQSAASETATAQQLKARYGSARMQTVQESIAEFLTTNTRTRAEIICKHWSPETILERSQIMKTNDAQLAQQAVALLKSDPSVATRLTVTVDTVAAPDWAEEKQQRVDFLQAVSQFIGMSMPLIQASPGSVPFLIQILAWAASGFKAGKQIEGVLDQAMQAMQMQLAQPKPPPKPTPADQKDRASAKRADAEANMKTVETVALMQQLGMPPEAAYALGTPAGQPPADQPPPGIQAPPGAGGPGRPPETALPPSGQVPPGVSIQ